MTIPHGRSSPSLSDGTSGISENIDLDPNGEPTSPPEEDNNQSINPRLSRGSLYDNVSLGGHSVDLHVPDLGDDGIAVAMNVSDATREIIHPLQHAAVRFFVSPPGPEPLHADIGFVNAANTTLLECQAQSTWLYSMLGGSSLDVVFNPAVVGWDSDCLRPDVTGHSETVRLLRESWDDWFRFSQQNRLQFCAGHGAIVVRDALRDYPHANRIIVIAIAASCRIADGACLVVRHFRSLGDITSAGFGHGNQLPNNFVLGRHSEQRGLFGNRFQDSCFINAISLEAALFGVQRTSGVGSLTEDTPQLLRECICIRDPDQRSEGVRRNPNRIGGLSGRPQFFRRLFYQNSNSDRPWESNEYEVVLDEYPRDRRERVTAILNLFREAIVIPTEVLLVRTRGIDLPRWTVGVPILQVMSLVRHLGVYNIPHHQTEASLQRMISLRGYLIDIVCQAYGLAVFCEIATSSNVPRDMIFSWGDYTILTTSVFLTDAAVRWFAPLRGRIQRSLTAIDEGSLFPERDPQGRVINEPLVRVGLIERIFRGAAQIGTGIATATAAAGMVYSVLSPFLSFDGQDENRENRGGEETAAVILVGITAAVSVASVVGNICQIRSWYRRLRGERIAPENPNEPLNEPEEEEEVLLEMETTL